jgi:putative flippase GtrA
VFWGGHGPLFDHPLVAKTIAIVVATIATYLGNAALTYRDRKTPMTARKLLLYGVINLVAIGMQLGCLWFSRSVLGLADPVADNISGTFIGQGLATLFRYFAYGRWVFPANRSA